MIAVLLLVLVGVQPGLGEEPRLELSAMFHDHAVIQLADRVPVWGSAEPGREVVAHFDGITSRTLADQQGRWMLSIHPKAYGGPHELRVESRGQKVVVSDLLVGEVWLCGGQSNMQWTVSQSGDAGHEIAAADWPSIRLFSVPLHVATEPCADSRGRWAVCFPDTAADYSAAAYYFGRHLHRRLGVPVGLVLVAWGGTPAEAWASESTLLDNPDTAGIMARYGSVLSADPRLISGYRAAVDHYKKLGSGELDARWPEARPAPSAYAMSTQTRYLLSALGAAGGGEVPYGPAHFKSPAGLYNGMLCSVAPYAIRGVSGTRANRMSANRPFTGIFLRP